LLNWVIAICNSIYTHPTSRERGDILAFERYRPIYISTNGVRQFFLCIPIVFNPTFTTETTYLLLLCAIFILSCLLPVVALATAAISHIICSQLVVCVGCFAARGPVALSPFTHSPLVFDHFSSHTRKLHKDH
jgi:hypothetical protein